MRLSAAPPRVLYLLQVRHGCRRLPLVTAMAGKADVEAAARALLNAVFQELRAHERAVRLRPSGWMDLLPFRGQSVMSLAEYNDLEAALKSAFPGRFEGVPRDVEFAMTYAFALLDGAILWVAGRPASFELSQEALTVATGELMHLLEREHDTAIAARVVTDIAVDAPVRSGPIEIRPVGSWGLIDAYRDIDGFIPGAGQMLDADMGHRIGGSFTYAVLRAEGDAPASVRPGAGYDIAWRKAAARVHTLTAALRLTTATTSQVVVDVTAAPGLVRRYAPEIVRYDLPLLEQIQRIGHIQPDLGVPLAQLCDHLAAWTGDEHRPHGVGVALSRYSRSFEARPWFDMLVDVVVGLEGALLGGSEQEEIGLRLRSRAAALLSTSADPPAMIYADIKRIYGLRSLVVHGSNPTTKELEAQAYKISVTERTTYAGVKWALALDRARDLLRRAILARGFLLEAERWPGGRKGSRFDVDAQLIDPAAREEWRRSWRDPLEAMGLGFAADEATAASLDVVPPDRSHRGQGPRPPGA